MRALPEPEANPDGAHRGPCLSRRSRPPRAHHPCHRRADRQARLPRHPGRADHRPRPCRLQLALPPLPDKVDIFTAIFDEAAERAFAGIEAAYDAEPGKWHQKIAAALRSFFHGIYADPLLAKACLVESLTAGPALAARYEAAVVRAAEFLRGGRAHARRSAELPESYEEVIVGGVLWIPYQALLVGDLERLPELYPEALEFILRHYLGEHRAAEIAAAAEWSPPVGVAPTS